MTQDQFPQQPDPQSPPPTGQPQFPTQPPAAPQYATPQGAAQQGVPQAPMPQASVPQATMPGYAAPPADPGKGLGIAGLVLAFFGPLALVGLILSIVARSKSKKAGYKNGIALAGIIVSIVVLVVTIAMYVGLFVLGSSVITETCQGVPSGQQVTVGNTVITCP